ncbi:GerAB/ArcD/ProY family transporter [Clostridium hydrogeniformans]|uniref:GerAB/ArcD/ProY family transporter n=1 Tax=Clostridium hydrogeniformans TaxID=349933 RepID=UPI000483B4C4
MIPEKEKINSTQLTLLIFCLYLGVDSLKLPYDIVSIANQDALLCLIISLIYPVTMLYLMSVVIKYCGDRTLVKLNKDFFGNKFGNVLNLLFSLQFIIYPCQILSSLLSLNKTFLSPTIIPIKMSLILCMFILYASLKGLGALVRISTVMALSITILILLCITALNEGSILNIMPVLDASFSNIMSGCLRALYYFTTIEALLIIHPFIKSSNKHRFLKDSLRGFSLVFFFSFLVMFICIYRLGIDLIKKSSWPFILAIQNIYIPIFTNFRYIFLLFWNSKSLLVIILEIFIFCQIINESFNIKNKFIYYLSFIICFIFSYIFYSLPIMSSIILYISPIIILFNVILICIFILRLKKESIKNPS